MIQVMHHLPVGEIKSSVEKLARTDAIRYKYSAGGYELENTLSIKLQIDMSHVLRLFQHNVLYATPGTYGGFCDSVCPPAASNKQQQLYVT